MLRSWEDPSAGFAAQALRKTNRRRLFPFHEPQRRAGILPAPVGNADGTEPLALARSAGRLEACPTLGPTRFMVPMHAYKRKEPFHEPTTVSRVSSPPPSAEVQLPAN